MSQAKRVLQEFLLEAFKNNNLSVENPEWKQKAYITIGGKSDMFTFMVKGFKYPEMWIFNKDAGTFTSLGQQFSFNIGDPDFGNKIAAVVKMFRGLSQKESAMDELGLLRQELDEPR